MSLALSHIFIAVALQAKFRGGGRGQLDTGDILCDAHFMTTETSFFRLLVNEPAVDLIFMTRHAGGRRGIRAQDGMLLSNRRN